MRIHWLHPELTIFPPVRLAAPDGLLAVGGDLSVPRLIEAYRQGIFPWYTAGSPILWWFTNPRCAIFPHKLHVPKSLKKVLTSGRFGFTVNSAFQEVMRHCACAARPGQDGTWILPEMLEAYANMHKAGWAHSIEAWQDGELAGGLYGIAMGRAFFGESMFHLRPDASKAAFVWLAQNLRELDFEIIDCQQETPHMLRFGAEMLDGEVFSAYLRQAVGKGLGLSAQAREFFGQN